MSKSWSGDVCALALDPECRHGLTVSCVRGTMVIRRARAARVSERLENTMSRVCSLFLSTILCPLVAGAGLLLAYEVTVQQTANAQILAPGGKKSDKTKRDRKRRDRKADKKKVECTAGRIVSKDTDGHCCWPGQAWNGEACVGLPTSCPDDWRVDHVHLSCIREGCTKGMTMVDDDHCCWPGQAYASGRDACVGRPSSCPKGYVVHAEGCNGDPDEDGIVGEADACMSEAEDIDGHLDEDGCPDLDRDEDGIADADDECPDEPEDDDGVEDDDGCPDEDGAQDTVIAEEQQTDDPIDVPETPDEQPEESSALMIAGWTTLGVGVAAVGTGVALHFVAESMRSDVSDAAVGTDDLGRPVTEGISQRDAFANERDANTFDTTGVILMSVGATLLPTADGTGTGGAAMTFTTTF